METVQLTLDTFDPEARPLCGVRPSANRFRRLCIRCPVAERRDGNLFCGRDRQVIVAREKYGLSAWKKLRERVLSRDGGSCTVCGSDQALHVHHIDLDAACDAEENLVTLCESCHARAHTGMRKEEEAERVRRMLRALVRKGL